LKPLKLAINKNQYDELFRCIESANIYLLRLTQHSRTLEPIRQDRRATTRVQKQDIARARSQAKMAYDTIVKGTCWEQGCCRQHMVNVILNRWESTPKQAINSESKLRLSIYLNASTEEVGYSDQQKPPEGGIRCYRGRWREVEISCLDRPSIAKPSSPPISQPQNAGRQNSHSQPQNNSHQNSGTRKTRNVAFALSIHDFVPTQRPQSTHLDLQEHVSPVLNITGLQTPESTPRSPQGSTLDTGDMNVQDVCRMLTNVQPGSCQSRKRIGLFSTGSDGDSLEMVPLQVADHAKHNIATLEYLLWEHSQNQKPGTAWMSRKDRLSLAIILASSVLHLDGSWLKSHWRSRDVLFLELPSKNARFQSWSHQHPFLSWVLPVDEVTSAQHADDHIAIMEAHRIRSATLFALALSLIELCLGLPFATLKEPEDDDANEIVSDRKTASRLLPYVFKESGLIYGDVVQRCIDCPFLVRVASLDSPDFRDAVFEHILTPLINDFKEF
jgi:hypothetical protein